MLVAALGGCCCWPWDAGEPGVSGGTEVLVVALMPQGATGRARACTCVCVCVLGSTHVCVCRSVCMGVERRVHV